MPAIIAFYGVFAVAVLVVFLPWVRRDKMAAFWFAAMMLAAIPEAVAGAIVQKLRLYRRRSLWIDRQFCCRLFTRPMRLPEWLGLSNPGLDRLCSADSGAWSGSHRQKNRSG